MLVLCSWGLGLHTWSHSAQASLPQAPLPQSLPSGTGRASLGARHAEVPPSLGHQCLAEGSCGPSVRSPCPFHFSPCILNFLLGAPIGVPCPCAGQGRGQLLVLPMLITPTMVSHSWTELPGSFPSLLSAQPIPQCLQSHPCTLRSSTC